MSQFTVVALQMINDGMRKDALASFAARINIVKCSVPGRCFSKNHRPCVTNSESQKANTAKFSIGNDAHLNRCAVVHPVCRSMHYALQVRTKPGALRHGCLNYVFFVDPSTAFKKGKLAWDRSLTLRRAVVKASGTDILGSLDAFDNLERLLHGAFAEAALMD